MLTRLKIKVVLPMASIVASSLLAFGLWFTVLDSPTTRQAATFDMPIYTCIDGLASASDVVLVVLVKGIVGHEVDYGTSDPSEIAGNGLPVVFYEVSVVENLRGETTSTIIVATPDPEKLLCEDMAAFKSGDRLLLFLEDLTSEDAPGIKLFDHFYVTVSLDNGVFDVLPGDLVRPRMPEAFAQSIVDGSDESITFSLSDVNKEVASGR